METNFLKITANQPIEIAVRKRNLSKDIVRFGKGSKLQTEKKFRKSDAKESRRGNVDHKGGEIPAVLYGQDLAEPLHFLVDAISFQKALGAVVADHLPTTIFKLKEEGRDHAVIVREIQRHPTSLKVLHLDFMLFSPEREITLKVPVVQKGGDECPGVKEGGCYIKTIMRHVKVRAKGSEAPYEFILDLKDLKAKEGKRIEDLQVHGFVNVLGLSKDTIVNCTKR